MNIFKRLFPSLNKKRYLDRKYEHIKIKEGRWGVSLEVDPRHVRNMVCEQHERIREAEKDVERIVKENATEIGWFSENSNWMFIQEAGQYLSPKGKDRKHLVVLTEVNRYAQNVELISFECTNAVYSEWVKCCCETMWHTKNKVLEDIHGNRYPVGDLCEVTCTIKYL